MTTRFELHANSRGTDEIRDLPISIDFCIYKHRVVTPSCSEQGRSSQMPWMFDRVLYAPLIRRSLPRGT